MTRWKIAIATQTPLLKNAANEEPGDADGPVVLARGTLTRTPGGVSRMVFDTVKRWCLDMRVERADWFSLQPSGPRTVRLEELPLRIHHLSLSPENLQAYARTKEKIWSHIHGSPASPFSVDDFRFYSHYNWFTADAMLEHAADMDVAYVHDFQLLQTGALLGLAAPSVFRWHVPFDPTIIPPYTRNFLVRLMEDFDSVIVSTQRDFRGLAAAGYRGSIQQIYPHINPEEWPAAKFSTIQDLEDRLGLGPDDPMVLCVARMDPMKSQDLAILAFARIRRAHPRAKLVLVGNGSFSNAKTAGLGLSKAEKWSATLQWMVQEHGLEEAVVFAHWISDAELGAAYTRADLVLLPSRIEGFGITVLEAWHYRKPVIVSSGAGAAEIVQEGHNGHVFAAGDVGQLAERMLEALGNRGRLEFMGLNGADTVLRFAVPRTAPRVSEVLQETIERFGNGGEISGGDA